MDVYSRTKLLDHLDGWVEELRAEETDKSLLRLLEKTYKYIEESPETYDKETVVQAVACYGCQKCSDDFDAKRKRCAEEYSKANKFVSRQIFINRTRAKTSLLTKLSEWIDELCAEEADYDRVRLLTACLEYLDDTPQTCDKEAAVRAIACYGCRKCSDTFDANRKPCSERYVDAEMFYERQVLAEHDEEC